MVTEPETVATVTNQETGHACDAKTPLPGAEPVICGYPAASLYLMECPHGHVRQRWLCAWHAGRAVKGFCGDCFEMPFSSAHRCPIVIAPAEGHQ